MRNALFILGDLRDEDIRWLARNGEQKSYEEGTDLITAGNAITQLYFVTSGTLKVTTDRGNIVSELGVGDIVGEMSFVEKRLPSVSVTALENCRILAVDQKRLLNEFTSNEGMAARFYRALATFLSDRLRAATNPATETLDGQQAFEDANELDEGFLDDVHIAGDRLIRLIDALEGRTAL